MGLKKRAKVSAEFSMSSLTDIIFLLLIFFMLTSTLVAPNSLNLKMPGKGKPNSIPSDNLDEVKIDSKGRYYWNGKRVKLDYLDKTLGRKARLKGRENYNFILAPDKRSPVESVVAIMDIALRFHAVATLAPDL